MKTLGIKFVKSVGGNEHVVPSKFVSDRIKRSLQQSCRSCSILPSRMGKHEVSLENMGNMENMENMEKMENINQMTQKSPEDF